MSLGAMRLLNHISLKRITIDTDRVESERKTTSLPNRPPVILSAHLVPEAPGVKSRIAVVVKAKDPDGDSIRYDVSWIRNGAKVNTSSLQIFPEGMARRGDRISAEIIATDGFHRTAHFRTGEVVVENDPPVASGVEVSPPRPRTGESVEARAVASDPNRDDIQWRFRWLRNGQVVTGQSSSVLPGNLVSRGDRISVTITPFDLWDKGDSLQSTTVVVRNRAPMIVSNPPTSFHNTNIRYAVRAEDREGDPLTFFLEGDVLEALSISKTGVLVGDLAKIPPGRYDIQIVVADPEGDKDIQTVTLKVPRRAAAATELE